jgi:hypothetical protein
MNFDDANPMPFTPLFDSFLAEIIEFIDTDAIASMNPRDAQAILNAMPEGKGRDALRDAMRDNLDADDDSPLI